jgi:hypothetical protein
LAQDNGPASLLFKGAENQWEAALLTDVQRSLGLRSCNLACICPLLEFAMMRSYITFLQGPANAHFFWYQDEFFTGSMQPFRVTAMCRSHCRPVFNKVSCVMKDFRRRFSCSGFGLVVMGVLLKSWCTIHQHLVRALQNISFSVLHKG